MNTVSLAPFATALVPGRIVAPAHSLTLVVKATFRLVHGGTAVAAEEQCQPTGDEFHPGDEERLGGPRYPSDFAWFKPKADVLVVGNCHAPGGTPTPSCRVAFACGPVSKALVVSGDRTWQRRLLGSVPTEPQPFVSLPLRFERSYGGEGHADNPVGKGYRPREDEAGERSWALPNIERESDRVVSRRDRPAPAGFGPLNPAWPARRSKLGTYDGSYLKRRWPAFPEDFDWSYFNAAPPDQQVDGYLRGDETLLFENLHPVHARYTCALPATRVRCFVNRAPALDSNRRFEEVTMHLDTVWVDMGAERLVLVWRGWTNVVSEDAEDVADVLILDEPLGGPAASVEECERRLSEARRAAAAEPEPEAPQADEAPSTDGGQPEPAPLVDPAAFAAQVDAMLARMGIDPASLPPKAKEQQAQLVRRLTESPAASARRQREDAARKLAEAARSLGLDVNALPPPGEKARELFAALGIDGADVEGEPLARQAMSLFAAALPPSALTSESVRQVVAKVKEQRDRTRGPAAPKAPVTSPPVTRETVAERAARRESFAGEDLQGLDLSGLDLHGLDFSEAVLVDATLAGANLQDAILTGARASRIRAAGADLTRAAVNGADLSEAVLDHSRLGEADLTSCNLEAARLTGADVAGAVFDHARLRGAMLDGVQARGAGFAESELGGASAAGANLESADFSDARLEGARFTKACLRHASMDGAVAPGIDCSGADITGLRASGARFEHGMFSKCTGDGSLWQDAILTGADFRWAHMHKAVFMSASLADADCSAADMKFARLNKADLTDARFVQANLFQGSLERATLTRTDFTGAHLFGAELLDAHREDTIFAGANLRRTKLETA